jgi:hypothetical protein
MQILINGLITDLTLAVLALGFMVVCLSLRVFYLALGAGDAVVFGYLCEDSYGSGKFSGATGGGFFAADDS